MSCRTVEQEKLRPALFLENPSRIPEGSVDEGKNNKNPLPHCVGERESNFILYVYANWGPL
ncbi:MAG: hypothetical protein H6Q40_610 [Deltaproteobacteria bacterium]|nr:hypothetical protein [Deltaproteobacteria bacterium]